MGSVEALGLLNNDPHCQTLHFYKIILSHAHEHKLEIPTNFMNMHGKDLSNVVCLHVPNGGEWRVELSKRNGGAWFEEGWKEFVSFYSIVLGHFILFRYDGNSRFHVVIFDMSACEIEYPCQTMMVHGIAGQEDSESNDPSVAVLAGSLRNEAKDKEDPVSRGQQHWDMYDILEQAGAVRYKLRRKLVIGTLPTETVERNIPDWPDLKGGSWQIVVALEASVREDVKLKLPLSGIKMKSRFSKSKKRGGSERIKAEKPTRGFWRRRNWWRKVGRLLALPNAAAISAASRHVSKFPSFMMVMTEAYIRHRVLDLPKYIVKKYIGGKTRDIHLQVYKRVWPVKMQIYGGYKNRLGTGVDQPDSTWSSATNV
ncbi:B3 domain-containing transcription factor VRN1-like protein [Drosera capensis]